MTSSTGPRALVVDDSLTVRMDLRDALDEAGFAVTLAASLKEARAQLEASRPDIVVLDVMLPDGDGIELLTEIRKGPLAQVPVILLSSEAEVRDRVRGLTTGANAYFAKPYDGAALLQSARALMQRSQAETPSPTHPSVLVIDDSPTFRGALETALEAGGYEVFTAATGEEGLRSAASLRPGAVIVDGIMPGIDGTTVVRRLRMDAALRRTPCVMLTGSEAASDELVALDAGADAYVRKTEEMAVILARLAAVMRRSDAAAIEVQSAFSPQRILAVDDSETFLQALRAELTQEGYQVRLARSGEEALGALALEAFDCILLDLRMPGLSGEETCRRIKISPAWRDIPLIMLTSQDERAAMIEGINAGADDFIVKSGTLEVLKARVRAQLRRRQFEEENRHIREELLQKEIEAKEAIAARQLAGTRAALLADLEQKNRELEKARELAERNSQFKSKFLANMSHELRTPLNAIIGFSELLNDEGFGPLNQTQHDYVGHVLSSGHHLLALINDILDISKIEANKLELRRELLPLMTAIDAAWGVVAPIGEKRGVKLSLEVEPNLPALSIDPLRIKQVLYNLLSNGIKFTPEGGTVRLKARATERDAEICVEDTGIGIAPGDLPKLFREFQQLESPSSTKQEGTGLGLALSRKLVEMHGGTVTVTSEPGKGSAFTVRLPLMVR